MMATTDDLPDRIRDALHTGRSVREVRMFGGLCFMVTDKIVLGAMGDGALLVRVDPARSQELLTVDGAKQAEMGAGRSMGPSWVSVVPEGVVEDSALNFWVEEALGYNAQITKH